MLILMVLVLCCVLVSDAIVCPGEPETMPSLRKVSLGSADEQPELLGYHWTNCDSGLNLLLFKVLAVEGEFYGCWRSEWEGTKPPI